MVVETEGGWLPPAIRVPQLPSQSQHEAGPSVLYQLATCDVWLNWEEPA